MQKEEEKWINKKLVYSKELIFTEKSELEQFTTQIEKLSFLL